jgi:succinoglycan biosynthesis transport protein ExoP
MVEQSQMVVNRVVGPPRPAPAAIAGLTPKEVLGILRRHILMIVSLTVLGLVISGVAWYLLRKYAPKYTAQTYIKVLPPVERDPMTIVGTQVAQDIQYGYRLSMAALITRQSTLQELIDRDKIQATKWFGNFGEVKTVRIQRAFKDLQRRFGAYAQREGEFIVLSMTCGDKQEAALIVNEMVDLFLRSQGTTKREEIADKLTKLEEQRLRLQRDLQAAEDALDEVRKSSGLTDLERRDFRNTIELKLDNLETEQDSLTLSMRQLQADIGNLKVLATGPINEQIENQIETDPVMVMLAQQLALMESELAGRLTKFGENHKVVRQTQELINEIKNKRAIRKDEIAEQTRKSNLKNAQDRLVVLQSQFEELQKLREEAVARKKDLDLARVQYDQRVIIRDERKIRLDETKEQIEKLRIMREDPETPKVQFVGYAPEPLEISSPRWQLYFPGGTMFGFMFGVGLALLIELLNDLVRTPRDVGRYLHIPLLGIIPDASEDEQIRDIDLCHVVRQAPYSIVSESYRRFRTNLRMSGPANSLKVLLVTSGMAEDGKTSVAVNLAATFVAEDRKVLLIDANFRRPALHKIFPQASTQGQAAGMPDLGLSALLTGRCGYDEVIKSSGIEGLDVINSGHLPSNPVELLDSTRMEGLIRDQRNNYDYVIIDSSPVLLVSDAKVLARLVDGTVLVFNAGFTRRGAAQRSIRELRDVNAAVVGCVLFAVRAMKGGYFHEQFKSYQEYQKLQLARSI